MKKPLLKIRELLYSFYASQCLFVVAELNIADFLISGPKSSLDLAKLTDSNADILYRILRCLSSYDVFVEDEQNLFHLTSVGELLISDNKSMREYILFHQEAYKVASELLHCVKTGGDTFQHAKGINLWEYLEQHPVQSKLFNCAMEKNSNYLIPLLLQSYQFSKFKNIIDVGGGKGHLLCAILAQNPDTTGIVADASHLAIEAEALIKQANLNERCRFQGIDFFKTVPKGGDAYILKVVVHDWNDSAAKQILQNCRQAMEKHSKLLLIERTIMNNDSLRENCLMDINMLTMVNGKERTLPEFQTLLSESGFKFNFATDVEMGLTIIEAECL